MKSAQLEQRFFSAQLHEFRHASISVHAHTRHFCMDGLPFFVRGLCLTLFGFDLAAGRGFLLFLLRRRVEGLLLFVLRLFAALFERFALRSAHFDSDLLCIDAESLRSRFQLRRIAANVRHKLADAILKRQSQHDARKSVVLRRALRRSYRLAEFP